MGGFVVFVIVLIFVIVAKALKSSSVSRNQQLPGQVSSRFEQARQRLEALRQTQRTQQGPSSSGWTALNIAPSVPSGPPGARPHQPGPAPHAAATVDPQQAWQAAWAPVEEARTPGPAPTAWPAPIAAARELVADLRDDPQIRALLPDVDPPPPLATEPTSGVLSAAPPNRYVGSAALESTLDSSIESSLLGLPSEPSTTTLSTSLVGQTVELPQDIEARVLALMSDGHEVAAVRLICDEMNCGLLDAMRTVQTLP
jgi:hypothetical protein